MDWGSLRALIRAAATILGVLAVVVGIVWCGSGDTSHPARQVVARFAHSLGKHDIAAAAAATSYPGAAVEEIRGLLDGMSPGTVDYQVAQIIPLSQTEEWFTVDASWHFGPGRDWAYSVRGTVRKLAVGWRIAWDPAILMPGLGHGHRIRLVKTYAPAPKVRDAGGGLLMAEQNVNDVTLNPMLTPDPGASAAALARAISPVASAITADSVTAQLAAGKGKPITAVTLRDDDYGVLAPDVTAIPGVVVRPRPALITVDRRIRSPMLDALRASWQAGRERTSGWAVQVFDAQNQPVGQLVGRQGPPDPDLPATVDPRMQLAAEDAAVNVAAQSAIVVMRPSTGAVIAVSQNAAADSSGPVAFTGLHPGGDSLNLFTSGPGPQTSTVLACLGVGVDPRVPNLKTVTGHVPSGRAQAVGTGANAIQLSTFGMAVAAATIVRGSLPRPMLVAGEQSPAPQVPALAADQLDRMRVILNAAATDQASADAVRSVPGLVGYSGYADNDQWFIGQRGDLVVAVHITDTLTDGSDAAARMAARMFHTVDAPRDIS